MRQVKVTMTIIYETYDMNHEQTPFPEIRDAVGSMLYVPPLESYLTRNAEVTVEECKTLW